MDANQLVLAHAAPHGLFLQATKPANAYKHPLRDVSVVQGPSYLERFRAHKWVFRVRVPNQYRITLHQPDNNSTTERSITELEHILLAALQRCLADGAKPSDYVHVYMECAGMDNSFIYNPCGKQATTLSKLMDHLGLHEMLEKFARLIQSGRNVYLDNKTLITIYTFSPPTGGSYLMYSSEKEQFLKDCKSIVRVKNTTDQTCYCLCFALAIAKRDDAKEYKALYKRASERWRKKAEALHTSLGISIHTKLTQDLMAVLSDLHQIRVHIFDISGVESGFAYRTPREYPTNAFFLRHNDHFHFISNINQLIRLFHRNMQMRLCEKCFNTLDARVTHMCGQVVTGKRKANYEPNEGEEKSVNTFIQRTKAKKAKTYKDEEGQTQVMQKRLLFLDFETQVVGRDRQTGERERETRPPMSFWKGEDYLIPPYMERDFNTEKYEYFQEVNHCEIQDEHGAVKLCKTLESTVAYLNEPCNRGAYLIAHCGGSFDFQMIFRAYLDENQLRLKKVRNPLLRGNKIVTTTIFNDIKLLDSYAFVAHALAKFPAIFNIPELKKGFFPHTFNRPGFEDYIGTMPHWKYYEPDNFSPAKRDEFFVWYKEQVQKKHIFVMKKEMEDYCHSDVELLRVGMMKFREEFRTLTDNSGRFIGVDPFDHVTIAGVAFEGVYCKYFLPENTIAVVPRPSKDSYSWQSFLWLEEVHRTERKFIQHANNVGEYRIELDGKSIPVDGFCAETNTIYQFHGCFWHGCQHCYELEQFTPHRVHQGTTIPMKFGELYAHTQFMTERYKAAGYQVKEMWECQWQAFAKFMKIDLHRRDIEHLKQIVPRDAYFGGRTNAVKLYYKCRGGERIHYMDITSMYPFVMSDAQYFFPVGNPTILRRDRDVLLPLEEVFGLIKCEIEPPKDLYLPVLPERSKTGKVLFHNNNMVGTWTSVEVQKAVSVGYKIIQIYEQHHFPQKSNELFREYNQTFFDIKRQAKADGNKGREAIAKMCINGPTGKWGYNAAKQKGTRIITQTDEFFKLFFGSWNHVSVNLINTEVALASVEENDEYTEHTKSNVYISAFITGYSRLKLYNEALEPLNEKVLYFDTDSVIYVSPHGEHLIPCDTTGAMGLWTSEADPEDYFTEFVSAGPKTYALRSFSGKKDIAKSKGFSLHFANSEIFNLETLKDQVICKVMELENDKLVLHKNETIMRRKHFKIAVERNRGKVINMTYDKRRIIEPKDNDFDLEDIYCVDTLPWGYEQ